MICIGGLFSGNFNRHILSYCDNADIEGLVVQHRQTQAVSWVKTVFFIISPRYDVACHQSLGLDNP